MVDARLEFLGCIKHGVLPMEEADLTRFEYEMGEVEAWGFAIRETFLLIVLSETNRCWRHLLDGSLRLAADESGKRFRTCF